MAVIPLSGCTNLELYLRVEMIRGLWLCGFIFFLYSYLGQLSPLEKNCVALLFIILT